MFAWWGRVVFRYRFIVIARRHRKWTAVERRSTRSVVPASAHRNSCAGRAAFRHPATVRGFREHVGLALASDTLESTDLVRIFNSVFREPLPRIGWIRCPSRSADTAAMAAVGATDLACV